MRVFVIESERRSIELLKAALSPDGFHIESCNDCEEAIELLRTYEFDAILVGRVGAGTNWTVKRLRAAGVATPVLAILDDAFVSSRISALAEGADDCLSKPFHKGELSVRLRAIIRRSKALSHSVIKIGNLEVDLESRVAHVSGRTVHLTATEYRMLEFLALRKGRTVARETIFESLYDGSDDPEDRVISVFVCKIRKKIATLNRGESYITTAWGGGYKLSEPFASQAA